MKPNFNELTAAFYKLLGRLDESRKRGDHRRAHLQFLASMRIYRRMLG